MDDVRMRETVQTYEITSAHGLVAVNVMFTRWKRKMILACNFVPLEQRAFVDAVDGAFDLDRVTKDEFGGCRLTVMLRDDERKAEALERISDLFIEHIKE